MSEDARMTHRQIRRFRTLISQLNELIEDVRETIPEATYYVEDGSNFYILNGPSHEDDPEARARRDCDLVCANIIHCDCGGW